MMDSLVDIKILEVKNPSQFTARVVLPWEQDSFEKASRNWQNDMQIIEQSAIINHEIHKNTVCAVKDRKDQCWHRVKVEEIFHTGRGDRVRCFFVDTGQREDIALPRIFNLPEEYQHPSIPFQVRNLKLWGLQPVSLKIEATDSGIQVPQRPTKKWDPSAETYFRELTEKYDGASVKVMHEDAGGRLHVSLFLRSDNHNFDVSEVLVKEEYARSVPADADTDSDSSSSSSQYHTDVLGERATHKKRLSPFSDSNLSRERTPFDRQSHPHKDACLSDGNLSCSEQMFLFERSSHGSNTALSNGNLSSSEAVAPHQRSSADAFSSVHPSEIDSCVEASFTDRMMNPGETLSEEGLKQVMAKVQRISSKNKPQSDTEARQTLQSAPKLGSRLSAESKAGFRIDQYLNGSGVSNLTQESLTFVNGILCKSLSVSNSTYETELTVDVSDPMKTGISKPSPSGSESSSYSELHGYNEDSKPSKIKLPKFRCAESSPELIAELLSDEPVAILQTVPKPVPIAASKSNVSSATPQQNSSASPQAQGYSQRPLPLTTSFSAKPSVTALASSAGRGRGLRKLYSEDIVTIIKPPAASSVPLTQPERAADSADGEKHMGRVSATAGQKTSPTSKSLALANQRAGVVAVLPDTKRLAVKYHYTVIQEFHRNKLKRNGYLSEAAFDDATSDTEGLKCLASAKRSVDHQGYYSDCNSSAHLEATRRKVDTADRASAGVPSVFSEKDVIMQYQMSLGRGRSLAADSGLESSNMLCSSEDDSLTHINRTRQRGKAVGNSVLEKLKGSCEPSGDPFEGSKVKLPLVWRPDRPIPNPFLGTMIWGSHQPPPVYDVNEIQFHDIVKEYMVKEDFRIPRAIQAHTWPALMRGRHVIGITPRGSGKTTAYLPSLVTLLLQFSKYQSLPKGCGPKAVILVPTSKKADLVSDYVHGMVGQKTTLRVLKIYGGGDHCVIPLLRGCDLLIATPHCLLRMLHSRYTFLDRLCHLVLDGAEVLTEQFTAQIREIMERFGKELKRYQCLAVTRQIMVFGTKWTPGVAIFQQAYQVDPVVVFASRLEAAVYGQVEQVMHMCFNTMHLAALKELVELLMSAPEHRHIIIVTADRKTVNNIDQLLKSVSVYAQVIDPNCRDNLEEEIEEKVSRWREQVGSSPVLVVTDDTVSELRVTSAHVVVHFDIPPSKTKFGNRLALMLDHFHNRLDNKQESEVKITPVSHLLVTNDMLDVIRSLHDFLVQSHAIIPPTLTRALEVMHKEKNEDPAKDLCVEVKRFGKCKTEQQCSDRHIILPCDVVEDDSEESWPPASGTIKVRVLRVVDASRMYVMLLEHQMPGQARRDLQSIHTSLTMDLAMHMANPKNQEPYSMEQGVRQLAVVKDEDGLFHRAQILTTLHATLTSGSRKVKVNYVDEGLTVTVRPDQLLKLPLKLQQVPPLAVEVLACRVRPGDGDTDWTHIATDYVKKDWKKKDLYGNIILRMRNTLWLDPLVEQTKLKALKTNIISMILRSELLRRGMAEDNPDHVKNLYKLCEGKISIPHKLYDKYFNLMPRQEIETETLRRDKVFHEVYVSVVDHPHHFYVQKASRQKDLEEMSKKLGLHMDKVLKARADAAAAEGQPQTGSSTATSTTPTTATPVQGAEQATEAASLAASEENAVKTQGSLTQAGSTQNNDSGQQRKDVEFEQGCLCVTKFAEDGSWNRAQLLEKEEDGWKVFFLDYGEQEVIPESDVYHLPDAFCTLPAQAIECTLDHVKPTEAEWSTDSGDALWDLSHHLDKEGKLLMAKVSDTVGAQFAGATKHVIELYDTCSMPQHVRFSQELVWAQVAISEDEKIESLFPKVTFNSRKLYPDLDARINDQCAALYWTETEGKATQLSKLISDGILAAVRANVGVEMEHSALLTAVHLIGYLKAYDAHSTLLSAIVKCVETDPEGCAVDMGEELTTRLISCLEQTWRPAIQSQAAEAAAKLAKIEGFTLSLDRREIISVMGDMLKSVDPSPEILKHVSSFLTYMLRHGLQCPSIVASVSVSVGQAVFNLLAESTDPEMHEHLLALLAAMAANGEILHRPLVREKAIEQILGTMRQPPSQQCVFHCARICQELCRANRRNKRILLEGELILIIRDLLAVGLQSPAKEICEELNTTLAVSAPQQSVQFGVPFTPQAAAAGGDSIVAPSVKWCQNSFRVLLTVEVRGAKESDFMITENQVHFGCEVDGVNFGFEFTLYGTLVPEKCRVTVHQTEVHLSLAKQEMGMWNRLLKQKQKCAHVRLDHDKLVGSSDSEVEEDENITVLARKKLGRLPRLTEKQEEPEYDFSYEERSESDSDLASSDERFEEGFVDPDAVLDHFMDNGGQLGISESQTEED